MKKLNPPKIYFRDGRSEMDVIAQAAVLLREVNEATGVYFKDLAAIAEILHEIQLQKSDNETTTL